MSCVTQPGMLPWGWSRTLSSDLLWLYALDNTVADLKICFGKFPHCFNHSFLFLVDLFGRFRSKPWQFVIIATLFYQSASRHRHTRLRLPNSCQLVKRHAGECNVIYVEHIEAETTWPSFPRRHFQMPFIECKIYKFRFSLFPRVQLTIYQHWLR